MMNIGYVDNATLKRPRRRPIISAQELAGLGCMERQAILQTLDSDDLYALYGELHGLGCSACGCRGLNGLAGIDDHLLNTETCPYVLDGGQYTNALADAGLFTPPEADFQLQGVFDQIIPIIGQAGGPIGGIFGGPAGAAIGGAIGQVIGGGGSSSGGGSGGGASAPVPGRDIEPFPAPPCSRWQTDNGVWVLVVDGYGVICRHPSCSPTSWFCSPPETIWQSDNGVPVLVINRPGHRSSGTVICRMPGCTMQQAQAMLESTRTQQPQPAPMPPTGLMRAPSGSGDIIPAPSGGGQTPAPWGYDPAVFAPSGSIMPQPMYAAPAASGGGGGGLSMPVLMMAGLAGLMLLRK